MKWVLTIIVRKKKMVFCLLVELALCSVLLGCKSSEFGNNQHNIQPENFSTQAFSVMDGTTAPNMEEQPTQAPTQAPTEPVTPPTEPETQPATEPTTPREEIAGPAWSVPLSVEKQDEISTAWFAIEDHYDKYGRGLFETSEYLGTYGDCVVFLRHSPLAVKTDFELAGYEFTDGPAFTIHVYKEGQFLKLYKAYENNWLTQEQIGLIHQAHTDYKQQRDCE